MGGYYGSEWDTCTRVPRIEQDHILLGIFFDKIESYRFDSFYCQECYYASWSADGDVRTNLSLWRVLKKSHCLWPSDF